MSVIINGITYAPRITLPPHGLGTLGASLRSMRKASKMSIQAACNEIGCSKSYLWELEHDKAEPGLRMAYLIASVYGVPLAALAACLGAEK